MPIGKWVLLALTALVLQSIGHAEEEGSIDAGGHKGPPLQPALLVPHVDELIYDPDLTLGEVIEATLAEFPRAFLARAFAEEARAWRRRAKSLLPGPVALAGNYSGDRLG
ncbi:MAG: hypothetical protein ACK4JF_10050, partial [Methylohalobius sp.]